MILSQFPDISGLSVLRHGIKALTSFFDKLRCLGPVVLLYPPLSGIEGSPGRDRAFSSIRHRIEHSAPETLFVIHHNIDEHRKKPTHDSCSISNLISIDPAVPGGAAVYQLISEDVETVEDNREYG